MSDEHTQENGTKDEKEEETRASVEPVVVVDRSSNSNDGVTSQPVEDATRVSNGEECALSPGEIKQIVANILATVSAESSIKGPSGELGVARENAFARGESSNYKSMFSSGKKRKASDKLSRRKGSRKNKTVHSRGVSDASERNTTAEKSNSAARETSSKERRRKKKKKSKEDGHDVFSTMRKKMRYFINKIKYEQSFIDAYGGEGWKGMSIDKLKPEKELQRASSEILRYKSKLRDLFRSIDSLCAEGAYPESMFDSEGLLDSDDIYCTICGSKELSADNDIVLCDGECNRAFHQLCLKPPLLTEEIPPEDQGWLCPGCDCKFDFTELLNDTFGSDLSMKDNWMSVFPEAAAAAAGSNIIDEILKLPSDDSEDDDFNPDSMDVDDKEKSADGDESCEGEELASDDSDFSSASEDLGDFINKELLVGNPTDCLEDEEDEDDDYDPDIPEADNMDAGEKVEVDKSGSGGEPCEGEGSASEESDFSSASEDLGDFISKQSAGNSFDASDDEDDDYNPDVPEPDQQNEENSNPDLALDFNDFSPEVDNLSSMINDHSELQTLESEQKSHVHGSKKRDIERPDYKKLYEETYRNALSDSSDDEEWSDAPRKRKNIIKREISTLLKSNKRGSEDDEQPVDAERKLKEPEAGPSKGSSKKLKSSSQKGSADKGSRKTLGEIATKKLSEAFEKNHYPERAIKEDLAKELGISYQKVDKWFGNARWSFNHPLHVRTVSKSNIATKSPARTKPGSKVEVTRLSNSSNNQSSEKLPEAKTTNSNTPVKISSPLNSTSDYAEGRRGHSKKGSPNSSVADATIRGDASKTPTQPVKRRSARLQESCTSNASGDNVNKGSTNNVESGFANAGESSRRKGSTPTQKGEKAPPRSKKAKKT